MPPSLWRIASLLLALLPSLAWAQSVNMPQSVPVAVGRLAAVPMTYEGSDFRYIVPPELDAFREYTTDPNEVRLRVIAYQPGMFRIVAIAAKDGKLSDFASCVVIVSGTVPEPKPKPGPVDPVVDPVVLPDGRYKFAQLAYDSAASIPATARKHIPAIAHNYQIAADSISAQIFAGATPKVADVLDALRRRNRTTLGANPDTGIGGDPAILEAWRPWFVAWQTHADGHKLNTIGTAADYAEAFRETATGLLSVK